MAAFLSEPGRNGIFHTIPDCCAIATKTMIIFSDLLTDLIQINTGIIDKPKPRQEQSSVAREPFVVIRTNVSDSASEST